MKKNVMLGICVVVVCIVVVVCVVISRGDNNPNLDNQGQVAQTNVLIEGENKISMNCENYTDRIEKTFVVNLTESGEVTVIANKEQGEIDFMLRDGQGMYQMESYESPLDGTNTTTYYIEEGTGTYTIDVDLEAFTGDFEISWKTSEAISLTHFKSELGYELDYNSDKFEYSNENGKDVFVAVDTGEDEEKAIFEVSLYEASERASVEADLNSKATSSGDCYLDNNSLVGFYTINEEAGYENSRTFCVALSTGNILVIETKWNNNYRPESIAEARINAMVSSIKELTAE